MQDSLPSAIPNFDGQDYSPARMLKTFQHALYIKALHPNLTGLHSARRVEEGDHSPSTPTDPDMQDYCIRLLKIVLCPIMSDRFLVMAMDSALINLKTVPIQVYSCETSDTAIYASSEHIDNENNVVTGY